MSKCPFFLTIILCFLDFFLSNGIIALYIIYACYEDFLNTTTFAAFIVFISLYLLASKLPYIMATRINILQQPVYNSEEKRQKALYFWLSLISIHNLYTIFGPSVRMSWRLKRNFLVAVVIKAFAQTAI